MATRKSSKQAIEAIASALPELFGGSADLSESNCTDWTGHRTIKPGQFDGNYVYYGVREFGMSAIMNGLSLHGGFIPFGGTFLTFSDYARNAVRLAALMKIRSIFVYTHDSVGLGEDGPTHQSVEHAASLRLIPNLSFWRPCDAVEAGVAWQAAVERKDGPTAMALTRQNLPHQARTEEQVANIKRGGYVLWEPAQKPEAVIIATGSEVGIAVQAAQTLAEQGINARVVSMPANKTFDEQSPEYRVSVLPPQVTARVVVEAGSTEGWWRYAGDGGRIIGIDRYGESAPGDQVFKYFGITADAIANAVRELLGSRAGQGSRQKQASLH
jgi:transketolase